VRVVVFIAVSYSGEEFSGSYSQEMMGVTF